MLNVNEILPKSEKFGGSHMFPIFLKLDNDFKMNCIQFGIFESLYDFLNFSLMFNLTCLKM